MQEHCLENSSSNPALEQLDWTASRVLVVRPGVVGATTGAGVGLPLLLFVVILLSSQTHAAVTFFNVVPVPTPSPSINRRYLTATTTTTKTTTALSSSDILWKRRDIFIDKHSKAHQNLNLQPSSSSSSLSSSLELLQRRIQPGQRWFDLSRNLKVLESLERKDRLEGGRDQINRFNLERRREPWRNFERQNFAKGVKLSRRFSSVTKDQLDVVGNVELDDLSNLRVKPGRFKTKTTTSGTTRKTSETEETAGSERGSEVGEQTEGGGNIGNGKTKGVRNGGVVEVQVRNVSSEITTSLGVFGGGSGVEWTTATTVAEPMSSLSSYPGEVQGAGRVRIYPGPKQRRPVEKFEETKVTSESKDAGPGSSRTATTTTQAATTELPSPTRYTSMEARKSTRMCLFLSFCLILVFTFLWPPGFAALDFFFSYRDKHAYTNRPSSQDPQLGYFKTFRSLPARTAYTNSSS